MNINNNLSPLPFYNSLNEQDVRKWWVYDKIYPLLTPVGSLLPFQIARPHRAGVEPGYEIPIDIDGAGYITIDGKWHTDQEVYAHVARYDVEGKTRVYAHNLPFGVITGGETQTKHPSVVFKDGDNYVISYLFVDDLYTGVIDVPGTATEMYIQVYNEQCYDEGWAIIFEAVPVEFLPISSMILYRSNGTQYADISQHVGTFQFKQIGGQDVIIYDGAYLSDWKVGQYYLKISDGIDTWYSDIFTVVEDLSECIKLEWWDDIDLNTDVGTVVYEDPSFRNILYLCSDVAKPTYEIEEEVIDRGGYQYPVLQISKKTYHFSFLAPEYMLDVMRLIRLSDHIRITDRLGRTYDKINSFMIEPSWEGRGDLASVSAEFTTDTVVKKTGRAYNTYGGRTDE